MKKALLLIFLVTSATHSFSQNRNSVWCFGDSALIDFSDTANLVLGKSSVNSRGSCASISDTAGNLLFYASDDTAANYAATVNGAKIYSKSHQLMQNGDSINAEAWYHEIAIIPYPDHDSLYYVFTIGVTDFFGIYYSIVDLSQNGGLGAVIAKNIQLKNFEQVDCINAIKHGNGRDWWIIFRKSQFSTGGSNNRWYTYLVTPSGIQNFPFQSIGSVNRTNLGQICFSPEGNKMVFINLLGVTELFDFDRCTGLLSNPVTIEPDAGNPPFPFTWSCAFSPDASKLYVSTDDTLSFLYQYDLNASNITASKDTLWSINYPKYSGGALKLAPDNKIYFSCAYYNGANNNYPYADTMYNMYNMNLSVINQPDSLSAACNFQPYSFYLGGKRTYWGLPNNPDYELGALTGSLCDTLTATTPAPAPSAEAALYVFYHTAWQKAFINAKGLKGTKVKMSIYDVLGNLIYTEQTKLSSQYFTKDVNMAPYAKGMYIINLVTDKERLVKKFIKN